jgi:hypothetical protein
MSLKSIFFLGFLTTTIFAQSKSAVQFYDTTGATKTGKVGWTGDAASGHMFIQTPNEGEVIKTRAGGVDINGTVNATKFAGDGSLLTNLPAPAATTVGGVTGLQDSLNKKATTTDLTALQGQVGVKADSTTVNTKLSTKANAGDLTALQTLVGGKVDTTMLKKKADTSWVLTKIGAAGGGTITGVTAGSGLTGGGTTGTVSISIPNGAIDSSKIAVNAITDAKIVGMSYSKLTGIPTGAGTITGVTADSGLSGGGTTGVVGLKLKYGGSGTAATVARSDHAHMSFDSLNVNGTVIQKNGYIGIGTISPLAMLHLRSTSGDLIFRLENADGVSGSRKWDIVNNSGGSLSFYDRTIGGAAGHRLVIDLNGNVGIGSTSPNDKVEISGAPGSNQLRLTNTTNSRYSFLGHDAFGAFWEVTNVGDNFQVRNASNAAIFSCSNNGNVGIGTSGPNDKLELSGAPGSNQLRLTNTTNNRYSFLGHDASGAFWEITNAGDAIQIRNTTNGIILGCSDNGNVSVPGNLCAGTTTCPSDRRYKTDITPIDSSLSKVSKLQGVYYNWDRKKWPQKNFSENKQIGLIAQDVEKVVPEVVNTDKEGYKSLSYDKLTAVLINAMKEMEKKVNIQDSIINAQNNRIVILEKNNKK